MDKESLAAYPGEYSREIRLPRVLTSILLIVETMADPENKGAGSGICGIYQVALVIDKSVAYSTFGDDVFGV